MISSVVMSVFKMPRMLSKRLFGVAAVFPALTSATRYPA
jgi:hypothetical protein